MVIRVIESLKAGKRLPEAQFSNMSLAPKNQKSVYGMFKKTDPNPVTMGTKPKGSA